MIGIDRWQFSASMSGGGTLDDCQAIFTELPDMSDVGDFDYSARRHHSSGYIISANRRVERKNSPGVSLS